MLWGRRRTAIHVRDCWGYNPLRTHIPTGYLTGHHAMLPCLLRLSCLSRHTHHGTLLAGQLFKGQKYRLVVLAQKLRDCGGDPVRKVCLGKIKGRSDRGPKTLLCQLD
jgi:hypothetical protein